MLLECVNAWRIAADFPRLINFIGRCGFHEQEAITEPSALVLSRIDRLALEAKILLFEDGEIGRRWPHLPQDCDAACQYKYQDGKWNCEVAVRVYDEPNNLATGVLFGQLGHYIEKVASGNGWLNGARSLRGNSFDIAVGYLARVSGQRISSDGLIEAANVLISYINGAWIARATGTNPMLVAASFLGLLASDRESPILDAMDRDAWEMAAFFSGTTYDGWARKTWPDEVSMCKEMDAMTGALLTSLYKKRRDL